MDRDTDLWETPIGGQNSIASMPVSHRVCLSCPRWWDQCKLTMIYAMTHLTAATCDTGSTSLVTAHNWLIIAMFSLTLGSEAREPVAVGAGPS